MSGAVDILDFLSPRGLTKMKKLYRLMTGLIVELIANHGKAHHMSIFVIQSRLAIAKYVCDSIDVRCVIAGIIARLHLDD